jgi:hypothetical protein
MGVLGPPVLGASAVNGLLLLVFAVLGFAVVAGVAVVILALLHAVLPGGDSGAEALHIAELERQNEEGRAEAARLAGDDTPG